MTEKKNISPQRRRINIDFLYLDLSTCAPCRGTESILDEAIEDITDILRLTEVDLIVNKVNVISEEQAIEYRFLSSPTIRINGRDMEFEVKESHCQTCSDLSGAETGCRVWIYQGNEYNSPPKGMLIEAILKEVYRETSIDNSVDEDYIIPNNLKNFYSGMKLKKL